MNLPSNKVMKIVAQLTGGTFASKKTFEFQGGKLKDEEKEQTVSIRIDRKGGSRSADQCNGIPLEKFVKDLSAEVNSKNKELTLVPKED